MTDLDDLANNQYQFLSKMSTEKLKSIVRADFESGDSGDFGDSGDEANDEFITRVMEVIAEREESDPTAPQFDVEAGWKDFQEKYLSAGNNVVSTESGKQFSKGTRENKTTGQVNVKAPQPKRAGHRFLRIIAVAALVTLLCSAIASAKGFNLFAMLAQWTQEVFQFQTEEVTSRGAAYLSGTVLNQDQTLQRALIEAGITQSVSPKWVPEGFVFSGSTSHEDVKTPMYTALYENESTENSIVVSVIAHQTPKSFVQEKAANQVVVYQYNSIDHYIMANNDILVVTWFADNLECSIMGGISETEMETMINSIYEE